MNKNIESEIKKIISEGWTDGVAVLYGNTEDKYAIFHGNIAGSTTDIGPHTIYDIASLTKLFLLIGILKLSDDSQIDINAPISEYSNRFPYISDTKIYELMNFSLCLQTSSRLDSSESRDEALITLQNIRTADGQAKYSDMGAIVLGELLTEICHKPLNTLFNELWAAWELKDTYWWNELPKSMYSHTQSYDMEYQLKSRQYVPHHLPTGTVHDKKAHILGACGHAGIFSSPNDVEVLSQRLLSRELLSDKVLNILFNTDYDHYYDKQHYGLLCYKKASDPVASEVPLSCTDHSIAISGFTGTYLLLDFEQNCYVSVFSNKIYNRATRKNDSIPVPDGVKCTADYVYRKDSLVQLCLDSLM